MKPRLYLVSSINYSGGRAVMASVDDKWYVCEGDYWEFDIFDGDDLYEIACEMHEIMYHTRSINKENGRKGIFPDAAEAAEDIRACMKSGSFTGSPWKYLPEYDGMTSNELRAYNRCMVMIGIEKSWYIMDGNNKIVSKRFPEDETINGVFIPYNQFQAKKEFINRFTREEAEEAGYRLCLVSENDETWIEILEEYEPSDIYPNT